jgi:hypothetical protein
MRPFAPRAELIERRLAGFDGPHEHAAGASVVPLLIAALPEFAVAQDIDADLALTTDHVLDAARYQFIKAPLIGSLGRHDLGVAVRIRQPAGMGGLNKVRTTLQTASPRACVLVHTCARYRTGQPPGVA